MSNSMVTSYPKVSNRERQRLAQRSIRQAAEMKVILLGVLAQKGGEVIVTKGTFEQLRGDMDFEVVPCPDNDNARIVRILK